MMIERGDLLARFAPKKFHRLQTKLPVTHLGRLLIMSKNVALGSRDDSNTQPTLLLF